MCLVAYQERDRLELDYLSDIKWDLVTQEIQLEGIFVFGGVKGTKPDTKVRDANLYRLTIGNRKHTWSVVETTGPQPEARYQHAMHFLRASNILILVGGRRLGIKETSDMDAEFIRETHVLNMHTLEWSILAYVGAPLEGMYNFSSCMTEQGDLYIFGGTMEPLHQN